VSGDEDIIVQSGSSLTFTSSNWSQSQTVTLAANEDVDIANGTAAIRISGTNISNKDITAAEQDNDPLNFVTSADTIIVPEGGTASFSVRLSAQPSSNVDATVTRINGDTDIDVQSGSNLTFTTGTWNTPQTVVLEAAADPDAASDQAIIRISANGALNIPDKDITATEQDTDELRFITDINRVTVREGGGAKTVRVKLSNQPSSDTQVSVTRISGDTNIYVSSGENLTFTTSNWDTYQNVKFKAAEDPDTTNGQATFRISGSGVRDKDIIATEDDDDPETCTLSIQITEPTNGGTVSGTVPIETEVSGTCAVDRVEFFIDGNIIHTDSTAPYTASWDTTSYIQANHNIQVIAYDANDPGNTADHEITVTVTRGSSQGTAVVSAAN
jgi:cellulose 1,4-beta-cellobiosidase